MSPGKPRKTNPREGKRSLGARPKTRGGAQRRSSPRSSPTKKASAGRAGRPPSGGPAATAREHIPSAPPGGRLFVLDVPFELRAVAQAAGAKWNAALKAQVYLSKEDSLPAGLKPFRSRPFSWERWREDDLNAEPDVSDLVDPEGIVYEPKEHQKEAIQAAGTSVEAGRVGFLLGDDVGLGKTISALVPALDDLRVGKLLVVCTKSALAHWRQTLQRLPSRDTRVAVINYDGLKKLLKPPESAARAKRQRTKNRQTAVKGRPLERFDCVIADESHHLGNPDSQRSRAFRNLAAGTFVIWASATAGRHPLKLSYLAPLLAQLTGSDDKDLAENFEDWCRREGIKVKRGAYGRWEWERNDEDLKRMHKLLFGGPHPGGIRRLPTDIAGWPEVQRILWPLAVDLEQRRLYEEAWSAFLAEMGLRGGSARSAGRRTPKTESTNPRVAQLRFRQKASLLRVCGTAELALDMMENGYQVFVSVEFHDTLDALREVLEEKGALPAIVHGRMTGPERERERLAFQRGEKRLMLSTITQSISLHRGEERGGEAPRVTLAADPRWSPIDAAQVEGRAHRDGQRADVYYLYGEHTVEERVVKAVLEGMRDMKAMHGDDTEALQQVLLGAA